MAAHPTNLLPRSPPSPSQKHIAWVVGTLLLLSRPAPSACPSVRSNAIGPFIVAKYVAELPYTLGYWLMITVSYFMTGTVVVHTRAAAADGGADGTPSFPPPSPTGMERAWRPYLWFLLIGELVALSSSALGFLIASLSANPSVVFTLSTCLRPSATTLPFDPLLPRLPSLPPSP